MYEDVTYETILNRMLERISDNLDKRPSSLIYDTHSATAIELQILYIELEYLIKNSYGDTAERDFLVLLAKDRGLSPDPARQAVLRGVFTPDNINLTGQRFNIGEQNYTVLSRTTDGSGGWEVRCDTAGIIGNQYLGQMVPMEYIDGLETAELTEVLIPGKDEEDTEVFRQRYFDSFNEKSFGGNRADYLAKVRSVQGVGDCKITRVWNGDIKPAEMIPSSAVQTWFNSFIDTVTNAEVKAWLTAVYNAALLRKLTVGGTVLVTVVDSDDYGEANSTLVQSIQTTLDPDSNAGEGYGLAPVGHVVFVRSAAAVQVQINTNVTFASGCSWANKGTVIQDAVSAYLLELRQQWAESDFLIVRVSHVENRILGVDGVLDVSGTKINGKAENLTLGVYDIPVMGGVSS